MFLKHHIYRKEAGEGEDGTGEETAVVEKVEDDPVMLAKAARMGWTPKDQFKGDPEKWRPAAEFLERGETMLPIVRATVKRQEKQIADLTRDMKQMGEYFTKAETRAYDKAMADLKAQKVQAVKDGDGESLVKLDDDIADLKKDMESKAKPATKGDDDDPVYSEWAERQSWLKDKDMAAYGDAAAHYLRSKGVEATGRKFLDMVTSEVKAKFPDAFENPRRRDAPAVEGATTQRKGGKGFADMPADARSACERMAKNAYPDKPELQKKFREEYVKNFEFE